MAATAEVAAPLTGDRLYQQRARAALPLLVRQARAAQTIYYSNLAIELGMPNARNLNYVLGSIGHTMENLSKRWREKVPPIQTLVVNKQHETPGEGIGWFLVKREDFATLPLSRKREIVKVELARVFTYTKWDEVLRTLKLAEAPPITDATLAKAGAKRGKGEGEEHRAFKIYVAANPATIGLSPKTPPGSLERRLPSADTMDVFFEMEREWVAVEVKSRISDVTDVMRGLFQCVKYGALMKAEQSARGLERSARTVLALEGQLPQELRALANLLGIQVVENARG